jgi:hypothetical protein
MPNDAKRFRNRARECRVIAKSVRNPEDAVLLEEIAEDLDGVARKLRLTRTKFLFGAAT